MWIQNPDYVPDPMDWSHSIFDGILFYDVIVSQHVSVVYCYNVTGPTHLI